MNKSLALVMEHLLHRGHVGGPQRGRCFSGDFERKVRSCFIRRLCLLEHPRDIEKKALETGRYLHRGPIGESGVGFDLPGTLRDRRRRALETEQLFMGAL